MAADSITDEFDARLLPDERALVKTAREFARDVVAPRSPAWQRGDLDVESTLRDACAAGLATIELAPALGGLGFSFSTKMRVVEELAKADFGFAFALVNHHNALVRLAQGNAELAARHLPAMLNGTMFGASAYTEPAHGSDLVHLQTTATPCDAGWKLNGAKSWTTNASRAGVFLTLVQTDPAGGAGGIAMFLVEANRPGFEREAPYDLAGGRAIGLSGFKFIDYFAPSEALLELPGTALRAALAGINGARCYVAAMCAGMLDAAINIATSYAAQRTAFGQPTIDFQGLRWSLVDAQTDLAALRLLAYRAAGLIAQPSRSTPRVVEEAAATAKKFAGDRTVQHLSQCLQALGANGLREEFPLVRHLIAAKMAAFADGTTQMMNERLGKHLVRRDTAP